MTTTDGLRNHMLGVVQQLSTAPADLPLPSQRPRVTMAPEACGGENVRS